MTRECTNLYPPSLPARNYVCQYYVFGTGVELLAFDHCEGLLTVLTLVIDITLVIT